MKEANIIGLDLAKRSFQAHGALERAAANLNRLRNSQIGGVLIQPAGWAEASRDGFSIFAGFARSGDRHGYSGRDEPASGRGAVWGERIVGNQMGAALRAERFARRAEWADTSVRNSSRIENFSKR